MSILILKIRKFKTDYPTGKRLKNLLKEKTSQPRWNLVT